jgi:hypothetical protein
MVKFEEEWEKFQKMSSDEQKKTVEKLKGMCLCPGCPTFTTCMREKHERLYCALGKSACTVTSRNGCLCPSCPVTSKMGLTMMYYCADGSEEQRRKKK